MSNSSLCLSLFSHALDPFPRMREGDWASVVRLLDQDRAPNPRVSPGDPKRALPAFSPVRYPQGVRRGCAHVQALHMLVVDVDNSGSRNGEKVCLDYPVRPEDAADALRRRQVAGYLYTTWSHTEAWPRFRMVVPLEEPVEPSLWPQASMALLAHLGLGGFVDGMDLASLRDVARIYFLPAPREGQPVQRWVIEGRMTSIPPLEAGKDLASRGADPKAGPRRLVSRSGSLRLRELDLANLIQRLGVRVGRPQPYGAATKWRTTCPWSHEHTHGLDDDCAVIIHTPGRWPVWKCAHSHHAHLGLLDVLKALGELP